MRLYLFGMENLDHVPLGEQERDGIPAFDIFHADVTETGKTVLAARHDEKLLEMSQVESTELLYEMARLVNALFLPVDDTDTRKRLSDYALADQRLYGQQLVRYVHPSNPPVST